MTPELLTFFGLIIAAFIIGLTPLKYPFQWLEVYYHELSHGLAALLTGGRVGRIKLNLDGSGYCTTGGGSRFIILLMGYTGASLWGAYLFLIGFYLEGAHTTPLKIELIIMGLTILLWVRDPITLAILLISGAVFAAPLYLPQALPYTAFLLQFVGIYVMLNAIRAPLHLIDGQHVGDGAMLADLTLIFREWFWITLWFCFGIATLGYCAILTIPGAETLWNNVWQSSYQQVQPYL